MYSPLSMWMPGTMEWIIIAGVALLIFGSRLPSVARSVGKSIVEFKKGLKDVKGEFDSAVDKDEPKKSLPPNNNPADNES